MILWYDRQGQPLSSDTADEMRKIEELLCDQEYKVVAQQYLNDKRHFVSTVWLGLDHCYSPYPHDPLIFETMVFTEDKSAGDAKLIGRYATEAEAKHGHNMAIKAYRLGGKIGLI